MSPEGGSALCSRQRGRLVASRKVRGGLTLPPMPGAPRLVSFLKAETFERGEHIIKEGEASRQGQGALQTASLRLYD